MPLRTLIVDDEPIARKVLREGLEACGDVTIVGEADNGMTALDLISQRQPDLVLLDLQMPAMSGLEVLRNIRHMRKVPVFVIVTAFDKYAIKALEAGAIDYLLKPVSDDRLAKAVEKARRMSGSATLHNLVRIQEAAGVRKIAGKIGEEIFLLSASDILAFQAEGSVVRIITPQRKYLAGQTLKELESKLAGDSFFRIHRSVLLNVNHVKKLSALSSQRWLVTLSNNQEFIASKRQASGVRRLLNL